MATAFDDVGTALGPLGSEGNGGSASSSSVSRISRIPSFEGFTVGKGFRSDPRGLGKGLMGEGGVIGFTSALSIFEMIA